MPMKILFTGGTCFTGIWFVQALVQAGHEVWAPLRQKKEAYSGIRKTRLDLLEKWAHVTFDCPFGSDPFLQLIASLPQIDLVCHHAADVTNYKSPDFKVVAALENNTHELKEVLKALPGTPLLLTGTVFEPGEGAGSDELRAVSPYGLSKGLTSAYFEYFCKVMGNPLKKFVIPNPFGPYEELRFTTFLAQTWLAKKVAPMTHPLYVRDNIPVSLLAKAYAKFATSSATKLNPSGYVESQGAFTLRFQKEMQTRLHLPCDVDFKEQTDFAEPRVRINTDPLDLEWNEKVFWDELANFYLSTYAS